MAFRSQQLPRISPKSYRYNAVSNHFSSHFSTSHTNAPRSLSRVKVGTHSPFGEESHTTAHTAKRGPSLPRPQHGLVPSAKFLLVLHAFIYIHFPVHCEPSTPAEEKNLSKLPPQTLSQTIFHRVFQLLPQTPHVCFHERKRVHTRLCSKDRTQRHTRRNRGRFGRGRYYYPRSVPHVSETLRGRGLKRQALPLLGLGRGRSRRTQRACGTAMRLCASLSRRRRGPAGLRNLFRFCRNCGFHALCSGPFRVCEVRGGITTLDTLCVLPKRWMAACQNDLFAVF